MKFRAILIAAVIFNALGMCLFINYFFKPPVVKQVHFEDVPKEVFTKDDSKTLQLPLLAQEINEKNQEINGIYCNRATIQAGNGIFNFRLSGVLAFEKSKKFLMTMGSFFGNELNIGSNEDIFWYWSARDTEKGLHWAKHEDFNKTRLKTPFDPAFLRASLGLENLTTENLIYTTDTILSYKIKSSIDETLIKNIYLDPLSKTIYFIDIIDERGNHINSHIVSLENGLPKVIVFYWQEENKSMTLTLFKPKKNLKINEEFWALPNYSPKINMAE